MYVPSVDFLPIFFVNMKQVQQLTTTSDPGLLQKLLDFRPSGSGGEVSAHYSLLSVWTCQNTLYI
jgi:hypothetical protein